MSALTELAHRLGVETTYTDGLGRHHEVSPQALNAILATFGYADASEAKAEEALQSLGSEERVSPQPPPRAYEPPQLAAGQRVWVMAVQLYTVRSARNWGIGDFTDLRDLVRFSARMGAAGVALNPLHALFLDDPERPSPYAPNSRLFLNALYIDPEAVPDFTDAAMPPRDRLAALRRADLIDYAGVAAAKRAAFEAMYAQFRDHASAERRAAFEGYRQREAPTLRHYATYEALRETMAVRDQELAYWRRWPEEYRRPDAPGIADFVAEHGARIEFFEYLQWIADEQLSAAAHMARAARMPLGLYRDLAVGIDDGGADGWMYQDLLAQGFDAGAPPDPWSELGQCWGFPPVNPRALRADKYRMLSAVLRANMRHAGALRIDHILGLMRMFWIPPGGVPADGVYVRYPLEELIGVIAAESQEHCCLVVGEDLGSVPEGLRPALHAAGIYTSAVSYFERNEAGFLPPSEYPEQAAASVTTHDLPTLAGWWEGRDIAARLALGRISEQDAQRALEERARQRDELMAACAGEGISGEPLVAVHRFLARTPSRVVSAQLADIMGDTEQVNLPGTHREYPNWRRKLPQMLDDAFADRRMGDVAAAIAAERPPAWTDLQHDDPALYPRRATTPAATYRLQFNASFTFDHARALLPYLNTLGVSHVYASSFLEARPGSTHGYDIIDHNALNPEIGDQQSFDRFCDALRAFDIGLILDFVPNHMGVGRADNQWWLDVLAWGEASPYAPFFDIRWQPLKRALWGKVLLPFLGEHYGAVLENGELELRFDRERGEFDVWYHEHRFPIRPRQYARIIERAFDNHAALAQHPAGALRNLSAEFATLRPEGLARRRQLLIWFKGRRLQTKLAELARNDTVAQWLSAAAASFAGTPGSAATYRNLHRLLERQAYRLAFWRVAAEEINYRRFFDINELAAIRQEVPALFQRSHRLVGRFIREHRLQGLRIDHIDGLFSPRAYLRNLAAAARAWRGDPPFYLVVEKILEPGEALPRDWDVAGTTGYEFAALLTRLFIAPDSEAAVDRAYRSFTGDFTSFPELARECKRMVMDAVLASELNMLAEELDAMSELHWRSRDYTFGRLKLALREVVAHFPVYRTYVSQRRCPEQDRSIIETAVAVATRTWIGPDREMLRFVQAALTGDLAKDPGYSRNAVFRFAMRFQQYTGPVMAKAVEDTAFYRYVRLLALNEVGSDPGRFAVTPAEFHAANQRRLAERPDTMLATTTHDTKRGEDARMRIAVLSEVGDEWANAAARWRALNHGASALPTPRDEYLIYQSMVGHWPLEDEASFRDRLKDYVLKAVREAKLESSWADPNETYEKTCADFIDRCLDNTAFMAEFRPFAQRIAFLGALASLSQVVLKATVPGVPDFYQGADRWDLSFVDPDNRRPVDFAHRRAIVSAFGGGMSPAELLAQWPNGAIKLYVTERLLSLRRQHPALFARGAYAPLTVGGAKADNIVGFTRSLGGTRLVVVVGRLFTRVATAEPAMQFDWQDTTVELGGLSVPAADLLGNFPAAVLLDQARIL